MAEDLKFNVIPKFSAEVPREHVHDWPEFTDSCPRCGSLDGCRPIFTRTGTRRLVAEYRHQGCGKHWITSWLIDTDEDETVFLVRASARDELAIL